MLTADMIKAYSDLARTMGLDPSELIGGPHESDSIEQVKDNLKALILRSWSQKAAMTKEIESILAKFFLT